MGSLAYMFYPRVATLCLRKQKRSFPLTLGDGTASSTAYGGNDNNRR